MTKYMIHRKAHGGAKQSCIQSSLYIGTRKYNNRPTDNVGNDRTECRLSRADPELITSCGKLCHNCYLIALNLPENNSFLRSKHRREKCFCYSI